MSIKLHGDMTMSDLLLQSEYAEIILELLKEPYNVNSVVKIVFISFCVRNEKRATYRSRKTDFVDVMLSNLDLKVLSNPHELACIFEVLCKLKKCGWIKNEDGKIAVLKDLSNFKCNHALLMGLKGKDNNPIIEINKLDDEAFMEEVLLHV